MIMRSTCQKCKKKRFQDRMIMVNEKSEKNGKPEWICLDCLDCSGAADETHTEEKPRDKTAKDPVNAKDNTNIKPVIKGQNQETPFKLAIYLHLEKTASNDTLFAKTFKKENKNIDDCATYIINQVKKLGQSAVLTDEEVFRMAVHYYDEDDIKIGQPAQAKIIHTTL